MSRLHLTKPQDRIDFIFDLADLCQVGRLSWKDGLGILVLSLPGVPFLVCLHRVSLHLELCVVFYLRIVVSV